MNKDQSHPSIVILTGAGISKESGLDTFRDADGIWAKVRIEDVATPEAFVANPARVHDFYNMRRRSLVESGVEPNEAHRAIATLQKEWPGDVLLVTQNIDNLHEMGGSPQVLHMHGELLKIRCQLCGGLVAWEEDLSTEIPCPDCGKKGGLRPHVVWFGEMPLEMERIYTALGRCSLFISIGTSGNVYPAAGFVQEVSLSGHGQTLELNLEPSEGASHFDEARYGPATKIVPAFVEEVLAGKFVL